MGKKSVSFRTTISVPNDLKERMDKVKEDVNWSALACRAWEEKLAEIATKKERLVMSEVVQRLRASLEQGEEATYKHGVAAGRGWAERLASANQLLRLERAQEKKGYDWPDLFDEDGRQPASESIFNLIEPHHSGDDTAAREFWGMISENWTAEPSDPSFVKGFAEGAIELWCEVQAKL